MLQKFKKDDVEEYNDFPIHNHYPDTHSPPSQYDSLKDLDTRISYQYPKGGNPSPLPSKKLQKEKQESFLPWRPEKVSERRRKVEKPQEPVVKKEIPKTIKEISPKTGGAFRPTEIPSPVFGFNRPKKSDVIVEHELSHFLQEEFENQPVQPIIVEEERIEVTFTKPIEEKAETITGAESVNPEAELAAASEDVDAPVPNPEPEEVPKRSRLPFNVMMLKQDKQKWEEQKRKREMELQIEQQRKRELELQSEQQRKRELELQLEQQRKRELELQLEQQRKRELEQQSEQQRKRELEQQSAKAAEFIPIEKQVIKPIVNNEEETFEAGVYVLPESSLLNPPVTEVRDHEWLQGQEELLNQTLKNFNVGASVVNVTQGPAVTRFEVQPEPGVKVNKITNLSDDIKLSLAARDIRIEAPIPGKHTIGIEVPNQKSRPVLINEIIRSSVFHESSSPLTAVLGLDIAGKPIVTDLKKMPHGLIAGATGSGKSVCINSILISLLYKARPEDLKLLLIDPKMVELAPYNRIPHLVSPVITDVKAATAALKWAVDEMERRYELFAHTGVRDINRFNELAMKHKRYSDKLPFIVIIIDELADLMMMSPADVEEAICRIAQKARACGIHLIVATQRPSVDVITGLIKANIPTRVAFSVSSQVDSRTIIDISGAEKLLGRGDMLFLENGSSKPVRLQGTFVSDEEIDLVVAHVKEQREPEYLFEQEELLKKAQVTEEEDELFYEACEYIVDQGGASTSSLQRRFKIGYNRAARLMDMLEQNGYITGANGSKPRDVLITEADLETMQD
ncbi:cell division FtsK/SpoIIIE [Neobacillus bataviensis LMG 21833]|uniref:Cell division FtsK/SpoIIIE n=1 Tax=Neobacillus bataviensis LMG 21833 TaxID=1117379 RepID=K6D7Z7_9BACI|nr:cell division FtsK/SpoIIIE [Neobacillus bataviensis LMG 21833]